MKEITAFKTDKGKIFEDKQTAIRTERNNKFINAMDVFVDKLGYAGILKRTILNVLCEHSLDLLLILEERHRKE